jgi:hypothetical protein
MTADEELDQEHHTSTTQGSQDYSSGYRRTGVRPVNHCKYEWISAAHATPSPVPDMIFPIFTRVASSDSKQYSSARGTRPDYSLYYKRLA